MASSEAEKLGLSDRTMAVAEEMIKGQENAARLKSLLQGSSQGEPAAESLVDEILDAFSKALSLLYPSELPESGQDPTNALVVSPSSETYNGKIKIINISSRDRRGGCRKRRQPHSWTTVQSEKSDDGYTWRKYGQKDIQSTKFPRSYFRCTHRHSQGCHANKQVQQTNDDPPTFLVSYIGEHTCKDLSKALELVTDATPNEPCLIRFGSNIPNAGQEIDQSYYLASQTQEFEEDIMSDLTPGSSSSGHLMLRGLTGFDEGSPPTAHIAVATNDQGDVTSSFYPSPGNFDMSFMADLSGYDDVFRFDQDDFL